MKIELTKIWLEDYQLGEVALRADFNIDRHYRVVIREPRNAAKVAWALHELAAMISSDPMLAPKPAGG